MRNHRIHTSRRRALGLAKVALVLLALHLALWLGVNSLWLYIFDTADIAFLPPDVLSQLADDAVRAVYPWLQLAIIGALAGALDVLLAGRPRRPWVAWSRAGAAATAAAAAVLVISASWLPVNFFRPHLKPQSIAAFLARETDAPAVPSLEIRLGIPRESPYVWRLDQAFTHLRAADDGTLELQGAFWRPRPLSSAAFVTRTARGEPGQAPSIPTFFQEIRDVLHAPDGALVFIAVSRFERIETPRIYRLRRNGGLDEGWTERASRTVGRPLRLWSVSGDRLLALDLEPEGGLVLHRLTAGGDADGDFAPVRFPGRLFDAWSLADGRCRIAVREGDHVTIYETEPGESQAARRLELDDRSSADIPVEALLSLRDGSLVVVRSAAARPRLGRRWHPSPAAHRELGRGTAALRLERYLMGDPPRRVVSLRNPLGANFHHASEDAAGRILLFGGVLERDWDTDILMWRRRTLMRRCDPGGRCGPVVRLPWPLTVTAAREDRQGRLDVAGVDDRQIAARRGTLVRLLPEGRRDPAFAPHRGPLVIRQIGRGAGGDLELSGSLALPAPQRTGRLRLTPDGRAARPPESVPPIPAEAPATSDPRSSWPAWAMSIGRDRLETVVDRRARRVLEAFGHGVRFLKTDADGRILVGLSPHPRGATPASAILRLNTSGRLDRRFQPPNGNVEKLRQVEIGPDGRLFLSGVFRREEREFRLLVLRDDGTAERLAMAPDGPVAWR